MKRHNWESRETMTPEKALQFLKEGNLRFVNNLSRDHDHLEMINITSENQFPFVAILGCSDSRTSTELIFDQGLGDVFSVRLAGNIASTYAIASLEFSCKFLGSKLIVVLGHTNCGAIKGACDKVEFGNIAPLLELIYPAVEAEKITEENRTSSNKSFVNNVTQLNVLHQIKEILNQSSLLREMVTSREIGIVGGCYDISNGKVDFLEQDLYEHFETA